jgi:hypothetical protein
LAFNHFFWKSILWQAFQQLKVLTLYLKYSLPTFILLGQVKV